MKDLGIFLKIPPVIYCDNISATALLRPIQFIMDAQNMWKSITISFEKKLFAEIFKSASWAPLLNLQTSLQKDLYSKISTANEQASHCGKTT